MYEDPFQFIYDVNPTNQVSTPRRDVNQHNIYLESSSSDIEYDEQDILKYVAVNEVKIIKEQPVFMKINDSIISSNLNVEHQIDYKNTQLEVNNILTTFLNSLSKDNLELSNKNMNNEYAKLENKIVDCNFKSEDKMKETIKLVSSDVTKMENLIIETKVDKNTQLSTYIDNNEDIIDTIKTLTSSKTKKGEFKISSMAILLTYQEQKLDKVALFEFISNFMKNKEKIIKEYIIVYENSGESRCHTHVYFKLNDSFRTSNCKAFDFNYIRPNIERVLYRNASFLNKLFCYLLDKDNDPYTNFDSTMIQRIKMDIINSPITKSSVFKDENKVKIPEVIPKSIHKLEEEDVVKPTESWKFKPWQRFLLNVVEGGVDKRAFYWCWDSIGNTGKTELAKYIVTNNTGVLLINTSKQFQDLINVYLEIIKKRNINTIILDLPRSVSNTLLNYENTDIFDFIEILKNGYISNGECQNGGLILTPCHVIVFANCITGIKEISSNKWKIIKILEDGEAYTGHVNIKNEIKYDDTYITFTH